MKLGFIGIGKIAKAVVEGFCTSNLKDLEIYLSPRNHENSTALSHRFPNVEKTTSNQDVVDKADIVFLCMKPDLIRDELKSLSFKSHHEIISFIPFLEHQQLIQSIYPAKTASRAIPLPSVVNHNCPIPVFGNGKQASDIFEFIGQPLKLTNEEELHGIWTLTGFISPYYDLMECMSKWATEHNVDTEVANQYVADLFQSLAFAAQKSKNLDFKELSWHAATPNGLNEQASKDIKEAGVWDIYRNTCDLIMNRIENKK